VCPFYQRRLASQAVLIGWQALPIKG